MKLRKRIDIFIFYLPFPSAVAGLPELPDQFFAGSHQGYLKPLEQGVIRAPTPYLSLKGEAFNWKPLLGSGLKRATASFLRSLSVIPSIFINFWHSGGGCTRPKLLPHTPGTFLLQPAHPPRRELVHVPGGRTQTALPPSSWIPVGLSQSLPSSTISAS